MALLTLVKNDYVSFTRVRAKEISSATRSALEVRGRVITISAKFCRSMIHCSAIHCGLGVRDICGGTFRLGGSIFIRGVGRP